MLRFRCAACGKAVKAPEGLSGKKLACPRCHEPALAPEPQAEGPDGRPPGFFSSMSARLRLSVALVAAAGLSGVVAPALLPVPAGFGLLLTVCSLLALLAMLHGYGTGCPCCGAWWSRQKVRSEVGEREVFHRGGVAFGRSTTRTEFRCGGCGHAWWVADSEEYLVPGRGQARGHRR